MMKMYWNWDTSVESVVFRWWSFGTFYGLIFSCIIAALICATTQFIASLRIHKEAQAAASRHLLISEILAGEHAAVQEHGRNSSRGFGHSLLGTSLFGLQAFLSSIIMLILMTFNGYLIMSCTFGSAVGYHLFSRGQGIDHH